MEIKDTFVVKPDDERPTRLDFTRLAEKIIKETGPHNSLKQLYSKYVLDDGNQKKFSDCCAGTVPENHKVVSTTD